MRKFLTVVLLCMMHGAWCMATEVKSPNGNVKLNFSVDAFGRPTYSMTYKGKAVVLPSHLGLELAKDKHASKGLKETDLITGFTVKEEATSEKDETWTPVWGETKTIRNHYVEYVAVLQQQTEQKDDDFSLDDITATPREKTREEIIAEAEAAAFAEQDE
jgi:hypothetical protein